MKVNDIVHRYTFTSLYRNEGICRLRTFVNSKKNVFIVLTELDNNTSASITNAIEAIAKELYEIGLLNETTTIIEHYEIDNSFSIVKPTDFISSKTTWTHIGMDDIIQLLETHENEFSLESQARKRIIDLSEKISTQIDQSRNFHSDMSREYVARYLEIEHGQISKGEIQELINHSSNERSIQNLLKTDLSIFAEFYARPSDQYICFSEFPIGEGFVDFVIFTGLSRMDIVLIEVKGADFNVTTKGHYKKPSSKIENAFQQIKRHLSYIHENYDSFRKEAHLIRQKVEKGNTIYNSFIGPYGRIEVDPNKEINIRSVIIGGRTVNDFEESKIRNEFDTHSVNTKLESWDSWVKKIQRN
jgi:hypothetical protein